MIDIGLEALLIMDKAGIPLLFQKFDPKKTDLDPSLLSGFLTAVRAFSDTIINEIASDFHINYGKRLVTLISGQKIVFAAIHNQKSTQRISPVLAPLLKEFEENFYDEKNLGESGPLEKYEPFRERIFKITGISNPSLEWIPVLADELASDFPIQCKLTEYIDNHSSLKEIAEKSQCTQSEMLHEISRLWAFGQIKFRNVLTKDDIVISNNKITSYLNSTSFEREEVAKEFPNLLNKLPYLISFIDGRTTVDQIINEFKEESCENIYWLLDYLFIRDAISILSPEKRRILMAKEIVQKSLEVSASIYSIKETTKHLKEIFSEIVTPEIISQIRLTDDSWQIDYGFIVYDGLTPEKHMELYNKWLEILRLFIFSLDDRKRKKYIEVLTEELNYEFFEKYRSEDMDGFEEFAFWLELIFN